MKGENDTRAGEPVPERATVRVSIRLYDAGGGSRPVKGAVGRSLVLHGATVAEVYARALAAFPDARVPYRRGDFEERSFGGEKND